MQGKVHFAAGLAAAYIAVKAFPGIQAAPLAAGIAMGSIFPDVDIEGSMLGHVVKPVSYAVNRVAGHRGVVHTPVASTVLFLIGRAVSGTHPDLSVFFMAMSIGTILHLIQDTFTAGGIMWFWPVSRKKISLLKVSTGHWSNIPVSIAMIIGIAFGSKFL